MKFLIQEKSNSPENLTKFKRNLSEFFLNFEPQKFNLCEFASKKGANLL